MPAWRPLCFSQLSLLFTALSSPPFTSMVSPLVKKAPSVLTRCSFRCCRHGCLRSISALLNRYLGCSGDRQAFQDVFLRPRSKHHLSMDHTHTGWWGVVLEYLVSLRLRSAGLLSLTVEFIRIKTSHCTHDNDGNPITPTVAQFNYTLTCGLTCSVDQGPFSPIRGGSANNIYVIPAPDKLTFDTATLLAAGCCIPAILSLISMWNKILEINWKSRFGKKDQDQLVNELIEGTNGATIRKMNGVNDRIRRLLSGLEIPLFSAAVLAILILGERNFWSHQVLYQTEPIASIGKSWTSSSLFADSLQSLSCC